MAIDEVPDEQALGPLLREAYRAMLDQIGYQIGDTMLSVPQWLTLQLIARGVVRRAGDVGLELSCESGTATRLLDQLERRGLVVRRRCGDDRRVVMVALSEQGAHAVADLRPRIAASWQSRLAGFSPEELRHLFDLLTRLRNAFRAGPPPIGGWCEDGQIAD